ncbi:PucR family transcriptional regulator [Bifidobacterium sp. ESL0790]|uniref:PucR family transcriptional regulator n=1 Tax=Bifidobacterium sp. ESL0790 TaxID=2983233 RepID=UPI0023F6C996|nr:PucR family transcriptional regulator [Bifidobacterium sp. ESL0790]WEV73247.1 helix-turn-helix domain-containing protein [Bifidobacterium sp. ESL0790]
MQDNPSHAPHLDITDKATLESIAFECLADGLCDGRVYSLLHVLDWPDEFSCFAIGGTQAIDFATSRTLIERKVHDLGGQYCLVGRANELTLALIVTQGAVTPEVTCTAVMEAFADDQPVCLGPTRRNLAGAAHSLAATLASFEALPAIGALSRPMRADDMLPERALIGDEDAADELYEHVYRSLLTDNDNDPTLQTVSTFLDNGGSLDVTAKELNVHPNTVRYRIKRAAESTGWDASDPRDAFVLRAAIVIGRIRDHHRASVHH